MSTPYNTGKVRIGLMHQAPPPMNDVYMDRVQSAICPPSKRLITTHLDSVRQFKSETLIVAMFLAFFVGLIYAPTLWNLFS